MDLDHKQTSFTFEMDNFSEKESVIRTQNFLSGGCEWYVKVHPKGDHIDDHLSMYLCVADPESLRFGWKRRAAFSIALLNQSGQELYRKDEPFDQLFCAEISQMGWPKALPLEKLHEKGFLENNKLILNVQVKVAQVDDEGSVTGNEMLYVNGFQVLCSQVTSVSWIFVEHPNVAVHFKPKNQLLKTAYMNILLGLIETLKKPLHSITDTELNNAQSDFIELTEAGFNLDWLKIKLDEVCIERKTANADGSRVQELIKLIKNLKVELNQEQILSLEHTVSNLKDEHNKNNIVKTL
ncbi:PREDICTED: MATH domain and coiled-coil domain-containing protein At2g42470-like [Camelina sativa]|uniref:MATH domain and coiled-coil domain-containing protein At2g42470-like n=1 Tax=Camelina sativa TaxID=90675 RepID=A0ABM0WQ78_CAMSA|nr:PREDICTED: MATH domain and coiled-coil domain-containing protein At2g42470-like [Camelina sativa]